MVSNRFKICLILAQITVGALLTISKSIQIKFTKLKILFMCMRVLFISKIFIRTSK